MCHLVALKKDGKLQAAIDSLVLTTLVLDRKLNPRSAEDIAESIDIQFQKAISLSYADIRKSVKRHLEVENLVQSGDMLTIAPEVRAEVEERIENTRNLETTVKEKWLNSLSGQFDSIDGDWQTEIWDCLQTYMAKTFHQHGARTIQLLQPDTALSTDDTKTLEIHFKDAHSDTCVNVPIELSREAIQLFFQNADSSRTRYTVQLLDGTFTFFVLNVDEEVSKYLLDNVPEVSILMDSNFLFGLLGLHDNRLNDVSDELIEAINSNRFPFKLYYHVKTLEEMQRTVGYYGDKIRSQTWRPSISRRALQLPHLSGIERKYHEKNAETSVGPDIFLSQYEHLSNRFNDEYGFSIYRPTHLQIDDQQRYDLMAEYDEFLNGRRDKSYEVKEHDILLWQTVRAMRTPGQTGLEAGAFFLTVDYIFYTFDRDRLRNNKEISTTILPNQLLQLLRPFISLAEDAERRFIATFAIPEFRAVDVDYRNTYSKVLSYMNTYLEISEHTALRILTNEMAMQQFAELDEDTEEFKRVFDSLLAEDNNALADKIESLEGQYNEKLGKLQTLQNTLSSKDSRIHSVESDLKQLKTQIERLTKAKEEQEKNYQARLEDERRAAEKLLDEEREETRKREEQRALEEKRGEEELNAQIERERTKLRFFAGVIVGILGMLIVWLYPSVITWDWLESHPNRLGLLVAVSIIIVGLAWAIADKERRKGATISTLVIGAILVIPQIIGGG